MRASTALRFSFANLCTSVLLVLNATGVWGQAGAAGRAPFGTAAPPYSASPAQRGGAPAPAEYAAFGAAMSTTPAAAQAAALQNFLQTYPQSSFAPQARNWLLSARARAAKPAAGLGAGSGSPVAGFPSAAQPATIPQQYSNPAPQPSRRAVIDLRAHSLTIRADNSSLSQILRDLSTSSGMKVEGLGRDERIYGSFGPGEPQDVLASLIDGLGYNVLMLGQESRGLPRELILSPRVKGFGAQGAEAPRQNADADQDEESADDQSATPEVQPPQGRPVSPGLPGAAAPAPGQRTTQEMLEELRRLHPQGGPQAPPQAPDPPQQ